MHLFVAPQQSGGGWQHNYLTKNDAGGMYQWAVYLILCCLWGAWSWFSDSWVQESWVQHKIISRGLVLGQGDLRIRLNRSMTTVVSSLFGEVSDWIYFVNASVLNWKYNVFSKTHLLKLIFHRTYKNHLKCKKHWNL